ncbi:hypothetical protein [Oryza sativa Japonica Group]|uniref:Uncharacterized protein n=1 Tax=Oryza sativa subsp. japonica TaxID=39947 RepID=Q5JKU8_ORYSJ|nr:hypothetical protein [Oryza sativa Japonica Group]
MAKWTARPGPAQARPCLGRGQSGRHGKTGTSCRAVPSHGLHLRPRHDQPIGLVPAQAR